MKTSNTLCFIVYGPLNKSTQVLRDLCPRNVREHKQLGALLVMSQLLLLTSSGCTPCIRVKRILHDLQTKFSGLQVKEVEFTSQEGSKLAIENNILYPPAVFLDNRLLAKGKIFEEHLAAAIQECNGRT